MPVVSPEKLVSLQKAPDGIRNICILAHVDHGKTSLTDALIATNGIISPKLAGKVRYLDSRPDEQLRGITMESSAISLYFSILRRSTPDTAPTQREHLINLIDSPGHIDFSSEVSTASRLSDGAVVLVDAVEGVCSQTVTVLRQTWIEKLKPLLVINKMDRLITELKMSPGEANTHLSQLLEQVNAVMGSFFQGERMENDLKWRDSIEQRRIATSARVSQRAEQAASITGLEDTETNFDSTMYEEKDDEDIYFAPEKNNVIFSSAVDGWAFTVKQFASLYEKKLGIKRSILEKVLWGDFYLDPKSKRVLGSKHLKGRNLKPMFVQLVLENIWAVYQAATGGSNGKGDPTLVEKISKSLSIHLPAHVLRSRDPRAVLTALFAAWLPLSTAVLVSVVEHLPSPLDAQAARTADLIDSSPGGDHVAPEIREAMTKFDTRSDAPVVAYVSKMVAIPESELPHSKQRVGLNMTAEEARELARKKRAEFAKVHARANAEDSMGTLTSSFSAAAISENSRGELKVEESLKPEDPEHLIGFARLFSGVLSVGDEVYVLPPKFNPAQPRALGEPSKVTITGLYLLMGRGMEPLQSVPSGVIFGVAGLGGYVLKNGTLCSQVDGSINLAGINLGSKPIVRVALEPENPSDLDKMIQGLQKLEQSDPCAEYEVLESGEHVILTAGELHLERCLKDLRERFAKCEIQAGAPIVPYRESIINAPEMNPPRNPDLGRGVVVGITTSKQVSVRLRVRPLPATVTAFLSKHAGAIRRFYAGHKFQQHDVTMSTSQSPEKDISAERLEDADIEGTDAIPSITEFRKQLAAAFSDAKGERDVWQGVTENIAAFGPRRIGPNMLIDLTKDLAFDSTFQEAAQESSMQSTIRNRDSLSPRDFSDKIMHAFQLATYQGPLMNEPVQGIAVFLEEVTVSLPPDEEGSARDNIGRLTGEVIKTVRESIKQGFLDWSPRVLLAMYSCEIQASTEVLGRVYGVITRRRGRIITEFMKEGTPFFTIQSLLPVAESFGFSDEIRKRTSGAASPQLVFAGFEMLDEDPFWVPFTEDDLEDLGELADRENIAKKYMDGVRQRKGLFIQGRKLVENAEKQKTMKR